MRRINFILMIAVIFMGVSALAKNQKTEINRIEPLNWWTGMHHPELQLLIYGPSISSCKVSINYPGVELRKTITVSNPNYLFLDLFISEETKPGTMNLILTQNNKTVATYPYQLLERELNSSNREGFKSSDAIYLIMPDRFANGDPANDNHPLMVEKANRNEPFGRHGGDLKGIEEHLDYIQSMGFTTLWLNPVQENNQPHASYHGYAITDFYKIDPRFGTNEGYKRLVDACRQRGMKMIMDLVFNHCGSEHWWMKDLPMDDWINQFPEFTRSNYRLATVADPHASQADRDLNFNGWFDSSMPDLNLKNDLMTQYLIQNSIWWIEYSGLQGIRMDTYPYPWKEGMREWNLRITKEYPNFNMVGETWIDAPSKLCYWQKDFPNRDGYNSELPSLMDFPLMEALKKAFNEKDSWDNGLLRLYNILADDHLYPNPENLVVFPENHDIGRIITAYNNDIRKFKMAMAFIATVRGIPQLYYGSEILMPGDKSKGDPDLRNDFPGGWAGDPVNAFTQSGRNSEQNEAFSYLSGLLNYRKNCRALHDGKLIHFIPADNMYVYFRMKDDHAVMVILNNNEEGSHSLMTKRFAEVLNLYNKAKDINTGKLVDLDQPIVTDAKSATLIELTK